MNDFELQTAWLRALRSRNYSKDTLASYRYTTTAFLWWCKDREYRLGQITHSEVEAWLDGLLLGPRARYSYSSRLASFYRWLTREEHVDRDPTLRLDRPRLNRTLPRPADPATVLQVMLDANPRVVAMIALGAFAGLRRTEIARLRVEQLLLRRDPPAILVYGKGGVEREVPMHASLLFALKRAGIPKAGYLFVGTKGQPISRGHLGKLITDALDLIEGHTTPHQLRHLFATLCYADSHDLRLVQELLGHATPATTAIYTKVSNRDAQRVVGGLQMGTRAEEQQAV